jgi:serine/threonine protein kinase
MREMNHTNLMKFEQTFEESNRINIVMEYCPGFTLVELIEQHGTIDEALTMKIVSAVLRGLEHMHS